MIKNKNSKEKVKGKRIHSTMPEPRKVLNAKEECQQKACSMYKNGCMPCKECNADANMISMDCKTCFDCENKPNSLRWDPKKDSKIDSKMPSKADDILKELELKQQLMEILSKMEAIRNRDKQRSGGQPEEKEEKKVRIPSYTG